MNNNFFPHSAKTTWWTLVHLRKNDLDLLLWNSMGFMQLSQYARAKVHQAEWSGSRVIVSTSFFAPFRNGGKSENQVLWPWPWNSLGLMRLSRYMFTQNFIKLRAAFRVLSCWQRKNSDRNNKVCCCTNHCHRWRLYDAAQCWSLPNSCFYQMMSRPAEWTCSAYQQYLQAKTLSFHRTEIPRQFRRHGNITLFTSQQHHAHQCYDTVCKLWHAHSNLVQNCTWKFPHIYVLTLILVTWS